MKTLQAVLISLSMAFAAGAATAAQEDYRKDLTKVANPTVQECKDYLAQRKEGVKRDDAVAKKENQCAEIIKTDAVKKPMKK